MPQYILPSCDTHARRWRLLDRKNMSSGCTLEQSTSSPQGNSTVWGQVPLLPQNVWHISQTASFSGPGHIPTTLDADHRMGISSPPPPMFQFTSSSLSSALSPSVSSPNPTPGHLQPDGTPQYFPGNCCSPTIDPGGAPTDLDYGINQDHHPVDPDRCSISIVDIPLNSVGTHSPACFSASPNSSNEYSSENAPIPNNAHSHYNDPNLEVEVPCVTPTHVVSVPPMSSVNDVAVESRTPGPVIPGTLVLEEAPGPVSPSRSDPVASTKSKRGKQGFNYKLSSSLPVTLE